MLMSIDEMLRIIAEEECAEINAALAFLNYRDGEMFKDVFAVVGGKRKQLIHMPTLSRKVNGVFRALDSAYFELRHAEKITQIVYDTVRNLPSFRRAIALRDKEFRVCLQKYIERQILLIKCRLGKIRNRTVAESALQFLYIRTQEEAIHSGFHQVANKLEAGGLEPAEALETLKAVIEQVKEIARAKLEIEFERLKLEMEQKRSNVLPSETRSAPRQISDSTVKAGVYWS
jgi:hypothetical protein